MISVRLSEVELEALKTHYHTYGARNISDLTRLALQRIMNGSAASQDALAARLTEIDDRVHALESQLRMISAFSDPCPSVNQSDPL